MNIHHIPVTYSINLAKTVSPCDCLQLSLLKLTKFWSEIKGHKCYFTNISETMRDRDYICVEDIKKIKYRLSFGEMTFDLGPRSEVKGQTFYFRK